MLLARDSLHPTMAESDSAADLCFGSYFADADIFTKDQTQWQARPYMYYWGAEDDHNWTTAGPDSLVGFMASIFPTVNVDNGTDQLLYDVIGQLPPPDKIITGPGGRQRADARFATPMVRAIPEILSEKRTPRLNSLVRQDPFEGEIGLTVELANRETLYKFTEGVLVADWNESRGHLSSNFVYDISGDGQLDALRRGLLSDVFRVHYTEADQPAVGFNFGECLDEPTAGHALASNDGSLGYLSGSRSGPLHVLFNNKKHVHGTGRDGLVNPAYIKLGTDGSLFYATDIRAAPMAFDMRDWRGATGLTRVQVDLQYDGAANHVFNTVNGPQLERGLMRWASWKDATSPVPQYTYAPPIITGPGDDDDDDDGRVQIPGGQGGGFGGGFGGGQGGGGGGGGEGGGVLVGLTPGGLILVDGKPIPAVQLFEIAVPSIHPIPTPPVEEEPQNPPVKPGNGPVTHGGKTGGNTASTSEFGGSQYGVIGSNLGSGGESDAQGRGRRGGIGIVYPDDPNIAPDRTTGNDATRARISNRAKAREQRMKARQEAIQNRIAARNNRVKQERKEREERKREKEKQRKEKEKQRKEKAEAKARERREKNGKTPLRGVGASGTVNEYIEGVGWIDTGLKPDQLAKRDALEKALADAKAKRAEATKNAEKNGTTIPTALRTAVEDLQRQISELNERARNRETQGQPGTVTMMGVDMGDFASYGSDIGSVWYDRFTNNQTAEGVKNGICAPRSAHVQAIAAYDPTARAWDLDGLESAYGSPCGDLPTEGQPTASTSIWTLPSQIDVGLTDDFDLPYNELTEFGSFVHRRGYIGMGIPDYSTGLLIDGFRLEVDEGARDTFMRFYDENGAQDLTATFCVEGNLCAETSCFDFGTATDPSIAFCGDDDTGLFRPTADMLAVAAGGRRIASFFENGTVDHEFIVYSGDGSLGAVFSVVSNRLINAGRTAFNFSGASGSQIRVDDGSETAPFFSFSNDTGLGMYRDGDDTLAFSANGNRQLRIGDGAVSLDDTTQLFIAPLDENTPAIAFNGDTTTGIGYGTTGAFSLVSQGSIMVAITGSGVTVDTDLYVTGKLTVDGIIDPTGLELDPVAANPGGTEANTLWKNSGTGVFELGAGLNAGGFITAPLSGVRVGTEEITGNFTGVAFGTLYRYTGAGGDTFDLPSIATAQSGAALRFANDGGGNWTIERADSDTIDGATNIVLAPGARATLFVDETGANWVRF